MASRFVLTAQVQLQAPTNTRQVVNQIQRQLRGVNAQINLKGGQQASRQVNNLNKATKQATTQANKMGKAFGASIRRFGAFTIATRAVSLFTSGLANATKEAIAFEREMIKISQVTGKTMAQLKGLENTITELATSLGVSSKSILSVGRILSQAGIQASDLKVALRTLAKTELAPTFDDITKTAEGAVAILAQFGKGVGELERQLGAINRVAGQFAVESGDLISVIRRTGGVFKAAGGDLNELIALFTSVRATTRESAESIATGLRTIFTRIQRPKTIEFLKQFGVELTDLNGKFIGPFEAIRQLSQALSGLEQGDIRFVRIAEELGGFRQIGKVIPLLQQFETAERARQAALEGGDSLTKDAAKAQQALAVQIAKVKEEFLALIRSISQTGSFQLMVKTSLELASALIKIADAIKPLLPLLTTFAAIKFARGAAGFARGIGSGLRGGASPTGFARGGVVPGTGNRDTVPAMLTPGEFVIKKSSVKSLGAGTLAQMNENRFKNGAKITGSTKQLKSRKDGGAGAGQVAFDVVPGQVGAFVLNPPKGTDSTYTQTKDQPFVLPPGNRLARLAARQAGLSDKDIRGGVRAVLKAPATYPVFYPGAAEGEAGMRKNKQYAGAVSKGFDAGITKAIESTISTVKGSKLLDLPPAIDTNENALRKVIGNIKKDKAVSSTVEGYIFEGMISALTGAVAAGGRANFDFPRSAISQNKKKLGTLFGSPGLIGNLKKAEAKRSFGEVKGNIQRKLANDIAAGFISGAKIRATGRRKLASGGGISGSDTVPALLTPGEFVFNKSAAKSIGYSNLNRMNKQGVKGYAKGGPVEFANGGGVNFGNITNSGINVAAAAQRRASNQSSGGGEVKKEAGLLARGLKSVSSAIKDVPSKFKSVGQSAQQAVTNFKQSEGFKTTSQNLRNQFAKVGDKVRQGENKLKDGFNRVKQVAQQGASNLKSGLDQYKQSIQRGATSLKGQAPKIQEAFGKVSTGIAGSVKKIIGPLDRAATQTQKTAGKLSASANAVRGPIANPAQGTAFASKDLQRMLQQQGASARKTKAAMSAFIGSINKGDSATKALAAGMKKGGVSIQSLEKAARKAAIADEKAAKAAERKAQRDQRGAAVAGGGMGGMGAMGIMMAATSMAAFIPRVEGATEGMGAVQNELGNTVMMLSTFGFLVSSLGLPMNALTIGVGAAVGAVFAITKAMDAYTGVHEKATKAIEEGDVANAGATAAASQAASDANKLAMGAAAAGAAIGTVLLPGLGTAAGAIVGGLGGAAVGVAAKLGLTEDALAFFRDNVLTLFGADSTDVIKAKAEAEASAARRTNELAAASKAASEALKEVKDGAKTIQEAFQSGSFTGGLRAVAKDNAIQLASGDRVRGQTTAKAGRGGLLAEVIGIGVMNAAAFGVGGQVASLAKASGADVGMFDPEKLGDNIGAYIGLWDDAATRTKTALTNARLERKKQEEALNKQLVAQLQAPEFKKGFDELVKNAAGTAASLGRTAPTLDSIISQMGEEGALVRKALDLDPNLKKQFEDQVKAMGEAAKENAAFLKSLNFGLKDVTSGITAFNTNLDNITESSKTGYNSLTIATNTLAAVVSGAGAAISQSDLDSSLNAVASSFSAFGATTEQVDVLTGTLQGFNDAQVNANAALETLRSNLSAGDITSGASLGKVQKDFKAALLGTIPDSSPIKDRLTNAFNGIGDLTKEEIEQFYNTGDASPILQKAFGPLGEQIQKQILGPMKEMESVNAKLIKATEERRKAELKLIDAQKKAIDNQIEAAKNLEFFGGDKFTPEREFAARRQQANLSLRDAGVAGLTTGSASDIRRASEDVLNRFSRQQSAQNAAILNSGGKSGAFGDRAGVDADRRSELKAANQALITITKQGIEQRKQELELIRKKNQAEKSALDSLLGGDVESFFNQAIGAAAGSALRTGDAAAASLFGAGALGKGLQGLQGTGLSDAENKRAAQLAFGSFGLGGRAAEVFTGTTTEEERIKAEGRELSQLQSQLGDQAANMESMDVTAKQVIINTQDAKFREIQSRVNQNQAALGLSRGGPVYASRGMFIPRGTDTVPAMLTPGEFVVNRAAVQRGNNLQILRSMNSNSAPTQALSSGGSVRYRANGSTGPEGPGGIDFSKFEEMVNKFQEVTDKLGNVNIKHMFEKLGTLDINHMFNGNMQQAFKDEILAEAGDMMSRSKFNSDGSITTSDRSVLG